MHKLFFVVQTVDNSKYYFPENKIIIDIPAGVKIFQDKVGILKHVTEVANELANRWNKTFVNQPARVRHQSSIFFAQSSPAAPLSSD